jgi:FkbM family methyltransferase
MALDAIRVARVASHSFLSAPIDESSVVIDLGVYKGEFARAMIVRYGCLVVGVEPVPELFAALPTMRRLTVEPRAITPDGEPATLHINPVPTDATIDARLSHPGAPTVSVAGTTFADLLDRHGIGRVPLVKVDIEGAEVGMLQRSTPRTLRRVDQFTIEFHDFLNASLGGEVRQAKRRLRDVGFAELSLSLDNTDVLFVNCERIPFGPIRRAAAAAVYKYPRGIRRRLQRR